MKCNKNINRNRIFIFSIGIFIVLFSSIHIYKNYQVKENFENKDTVIKDTVIKYTNTRAFYINLDKNTKREKDFIESYKHSDIHEIGLSRFPAILGKNVDLNLWLNPETIKELHEIEKTKKRIYHYQLTYGGVGCFLSHYTLANQLLNDKNSDYYIICEDDIEFCYNTLKNIQSYLSNPPEDWDIIYFNYIRMSTFNRYGKFVKPDGFWGTQCYIISKKGAKKLVDEVNKEKIDGQIDAYLSRMIQQNKINIYMTDNKLISVNENSAISNIQYKLKHVSSEINPFNYKGYLV